MAYRKLALTSALLTGLAVTAVVIIVPAEAGSQDCVSPTSASVNEELTERFGSYGDTAGEWTGADSAYSVDLPDGSTAWLYSDTFLGEVDEDGGRPEDSPFINNSIIVDDDGSLRTHTGGTQDDPDALAVPDTDEDSWYWFGDGTVEGDELQVTLLEFEKTGDGPLDFGFVGNAVATFDVEDMSLTSITDLPESESQINWGSAIYEDPSEGYTYVFGVEDLQEEKFAHLARVPSDSLTGADWEYFADGQWSDDPTASTRIAEGVSNEFSVTKFQGGGFALVAGDATEELSDKIVMYRSDDLEGPYTDKTVLYETPETGGDIYTYNAKAHPNLGDDDRLLVTYNVNSLNPDDLYDDVDNYRPRYLDVEPEAAEGEC